MCFAVRMLSHYSILDKFQTDFFVVGIHALEYFWLSWKKNFLFIWSKVYFMCASVLC